MAPKGKKSKAEEAADFLSTLDDFDVPTDPPAPAATGEKAGGTGTASTTAAASSVAAAPLGSSPSATTAPAGPTAALQATASSAEPRASIDSKRSVRSGYDVGTSSSPAPPSAGGVEQDEEAAKALAFLEEQIKTKRAPLSVPGPGSLRTASGPLSGTKAGSAKAGSASSSSFAKESTAPNEPTSDSAAAAGGGGWGSWWSSATSAVQAAQKIADEGYKKVRAEGVSGLEGVKVGGVDLGSIKKGAEERLKGIQGMQIQGIDLDKLRHDLLSNTQSALTTLINTVAPPISEHETLELWLSHPLIGYAGVEGVVYRAWTRILEQTDSGELVVIWSPPESVEGLEERGMYPVDGWQAAWEVAGKEIKAVRAREEKEPVGRGKENPNVPVTTVPIFLHLQPVLGPLPFAQPSLILSSTASDDKAPSTESKAPNHLYFILSLTDPSHSIRFTTVTQPSPADWLDVEYERSDWVEERLVDVIRTGVEVIAQDYVATRMGLKARSDGDATPAPADKEVDQTAAATSQLDEAKGDKKD